jgi:integrase/recombinase XerC
VSVAKNRARVARCRAKTLGLRMAQPGNTFNLYDGDRLVHCGRLHEIEAYLAERHIRRCPGPKRSAEPAPWTGILNDYTVHLAAAGRPQTTIELRRIQLARMARELHAKPADVTGEMLVAWFGRHTEWQPETRRSDRAAVRGFFTWAYRTNRVPHYLGDELPNVRQPKASPRPAPDQAWRQALLVADPRVTLMLRLAAEAGMRRAEVAQVHTRDLLEGVDGAQLLVHGKGQKQRVVPISDSLAELIRAGAAGHTPGMPGRGWLFPSWPDGGHLTPQYVGILVAKVLPDQCTMHTLRHRFASRAYRGTRNLRAVQMLLGHTSIATTERYLAVDDSEIRAAMVAAL